MASKLFVGNLAFSTTRDELETLFREVGALRDVFLPLDRDTQRPRGFAFVEFENDEDAEKAIEKFNGYELGGRALRVNVSDDRPRRPGFSPGGGGGDRPRFDGRGGGGPGGGGAGKPKGSRRNIRAKKRSL